jgi:hypothetical protein
MTEPRKLVAWTAAVLFGFFGMARVALAGNVCPGSLSTCHTNWFAGNGSLLIKNKTEDSKDKLIWKAKGSALTQADFGDPQNTTEYAFCIYAGSTNALVAEIDVPPSPSKWTVVGTKGYKFLDLTLADGGAQTILLKGSGNHGRILLKGSGVNLPDPLNSGSLPLPVTVQLFSQQTDSCFNTEFQNTPLRNTTTVFKAKY